MFSTVYISYCIEIDIVNTIERRIKKITGNFLI